MLDSCTMWFGITIENALQERVKVGYGDKIEYQPKYTLARLLHQDFRLPAPEKEPEQSPNPWAGLMAWAGKANSGVKWYRYVDPGKTVD